jgi:hypothetical protein
MCEMLQFCQYEETLSDRGLDLRYLFAEILQESFLQLSSGFSRHLADNTEAFVEFGEDLRAFTSKRASIASRISGSSA